MQIPAWRCAWMVADQDVLPQADLVLASIGYRSEAMPGAPFDAASGTVTNT